MQILDNPNIVTCYEVVENEKQMIILMEWLRGGHLLDTLEEMSGQHYSEQQAAILFVQVLGSTLLSCQGELKLSEHCQRARDAQVVIQTTISDAPSIVLLCLYRLSSDLRRVSVLSGPSTEAVLFSYMTYSYTQQWNLALHFV